MDIPKPPPSNLSWKKGHWVDFQIPAGLWEGMNSSLVACPNLCLEALEPLLTSHSVSTYHMLNSLQAHLSKLHNDPKDVGAIIISIL